MITSFIGVFEDKLQVHKDQLKKELQKAKSERRIAWMKDTIKEAKDLQKLVKEAKGQEVCPHCGGQL